MKPPVAGESSPVLVRAIRAGARTYFRRPHRVGSKSAASIDGVPTVGFVHTVLSLPPTFAELAGELVPDAETFHIVDETLLGVTRKAGSLTPATRRRVLGYVESAVEAGADLVVVTCSSIGPAVDASRSFVETPVLRIDEPMADEAVRLGSRIGVVATLSTTLEPTVQLVERRAREAEKDVEVVSRLCDGAFDALAAGDRERHDELVREALRELTANVDVVVLAQASMARVADTLSEAERRVPILASPRLGMQRVAELLA
jgi:Asp/Glu/hydantoin racemase